MTSSESDIINLQYQFIEERPTMAAHNTDPLAILKLLKIEIAEFEEAYQGEYPVDAVAREAADIAIFVITLFKTLGLDMKQEVLKKIQRNEEKYPAELFQTAVFEIGAALAKKRWITLGGDEAFYEKHQKGVMHEST